MFARNIRKIGWSKLSDHTRTYQGTQKMNKPELAAAVAELANISRAQAAEVINVMLDEISNALAKGDKVALPGLGSFNPTNRAARTGKNPRTGEAISIKASKSVGFKPAKALKDAIA
jgi:DNA-binding protein HU-alpha